MKRSSIILLFALSFACTQAGAQTILLEPFIDNTLYESSTGSLSNGAGESLFFGRTNQALALQKRRALMKFDIENNIPAGAVITAATLSITVTQTPNGGASTDASLHRVLSAWGEGASNALNNEGPGTSALTNDATWLHTFHPGSFWVTPGGDFDTTVSATTAFFGNGSYSWSDAQMIVDIQGWRDVPATNHGWLVLGNESTALTARRFSSSENPTASTRPKLSITYVMPVTISGAVYTEIDSFIGGVSVVLSGDASDTIVTAADGLYSFSVIPGGNYTVTPFKNNDAVTNNGVTTGDIPLIRKQALTQNFLSSPYKVIAADANNSGTVTTADVTFTRRVALNNTFTFPVTTNPLIYGRLWEFVNSDQLFAGPPYNPFPFLKTRTYNNLNSNQTNQDFIGIKIGDVNNSWNP